MPESTEALVEQLAQLRETYVAGLPEKVRRIEDAWHAVREDGWTARALDNLHRLSHGLAGSGATFGFASISSAARALEHNVKQILDTGVNGDGTAEARRTEDLAALAGALTTAAANVEAAVEETPSWGLVAPTGVTESADGERILMVDDDRESAEALAARVRLFGYQVRTVCELAELDAAVAEAPPAAVVMDLMFPEGGLAGAAAMQELQKGRTAPLPVVFASARNDLAGRVESVRAGGRAFFAKPIDATSLVETLDRLTGRDEPEPARVLIVDDVSSVASYFDIVLHQAGMETMAINDPMAIIGALVDFRPDLILMDLYMPDCTGVELVHVIRQQPAYATIPIVFLSNESDRDKQLDAMRSGGDDFLTKPVEPDRLVSVVSIRIERWRALRALIACDSLTGLANKASTYAALEAEAARAIRHDTELSFALVDIDHFRGINETHGHTTGDRVLKGLARLFEERLRKSDEIGRTDGGEFAVIVPHSDGAAAATLLNGVRERFSGVRFQTEAGAFNATLSCGIASLPAFGDPVALDRGARTALREAKQRGRNRVVLAKS